MPARAPELPPACPAMGHYWPHAIPAIAFKVMSVCWINLCRNGVSAADELGLCTEHKEELAEHSR